ncbi:MAG: glycoside hydrolase family 3 N-terminal domain-containing protein [Bauldia sp.]
MPPHAGKNADPLGRARELIGRMTETEKVAQLRSVWLSYDPAGAAFVLDPAFPQGGSLRAAIKDGIGHFTRPYGTSQVSFRDGVRALNAAQKFLVEETRLGIPAIAHEESLAGLMSLEGTQFPAALNLGATWDPQLARRIAETIRRLMRSVGAQQSLGPVADVVRDARWGRVEECIGEDTYLVGVMVANTVRGLQGESLAEGVVATPKHFAAHSFGEGGRNHAPVHIGRRELADIFLVPFEMAVKAAGAQSIMSSYHDIDGVPGSASHYLLTEVLRENWGFEGTVVSDYFAVRFLQTRHRVVADETEAAARALHAGLDVELPVSECYERGLPEALKRGLVTQAEIDLAVERVLAQKFALGLFEQPYVEEGGPYVLQGDRVLNREAAERSLVLLKNDGFLPLTGSGQIALIGPGADDQLALFGNYHFPTTQRWTAGRTVPVVAETLRQAMEAEFGAARVAYAEGCRVLPLNDRKVYFEDGEPVADPTRPLVDMDRSGIAAAAALAKRSDLAVVAVGDRAGLFAAGTVGEGCDVDTLTLPGAQAELVEAVLATGTPTVVVLLAGRPYDLTAIAPRARAVVFAGFPGEEGAGAIARVLSGKVNPSGKLTVTFPASAGSGPMFYNAKVLSGGLPRAEYYKPVFPFGHGLSYTTFAYAGLDVDRSDWPVGGRIRISCTVSNTGTRGGEEIVQLYLSDVVASVVPPVIELKGFHRLALVPGAAKRVTFDVHSDLLSFTGEDFRRIVEPGEIAIRIGASSADIRLETRVHVTGVTTETASDREMFTHVTEQAIAPV